LVNSGDIWEIRVEMGGDAFRLLGFLHGAKFVVLTHAFRKKSQKTPLTDLRLAEQRKEEYIRRARNK
jgi:phage-related protein